MLERIIEWSAMNRFMVLLIVSVIAAAGIWTTLNMPIDAIPDLSDVQVIIRTEYPGQGPQIVEEQVTYPLASAMLSVPFAETVRGYSMFGTSFVYVIFEDGTDLYWARSRVIEYLSYISDQLPDKVKPAIGPDATGVGWVYQYSVVDTTGALDLSQLRSLQDYFLKYELQTVPGVSEVASIGGFTKEYQVVVDPQKMAAYEISLRDLKKAIQTSNTDVGGRLLEIAEREFIVRGKGYLRGIEDIRDVPLKASAGNTITVADVATVSVGPEIRRGITDKNGEGEVVSGIIVMRYGENAQKVIENVKIRIRELEPGLPPGVRIVEEYDRSELIGEAVHAVSVKIWEELFVVSLIVIIFLLHVRSAFVALVTIPVGILVALLIMSLMGINANIMSLGGIAIAIGVMVDASLVMVENAHKHLERSAAAGTLTDEPSRIQAVIAAAKEVGPSLFFSLLIVTVSFLPVFSLQQVEGRLFLPLALTKTFAMAASAMLAITLVPALMVLFIKGKIPAEEKNPISRVIISTYRPVIRLALRFPNTFLGIGGILLLSTLLPVQRLVFGDVYIPAPQIGSEFMPPLDEGDLLYMPSTLPGVSPRKAKEILQETDRIIASFPEVKSVLGKIGRAETATDPAPLSMLETMVILKPKSEWRAGLSTRDLIREMDEATKLPGLTNLWTMPIKNRTDMLATGIKTPVGVKVAGPDLRVLEKIAGDIELAVRPVAGTRSVFAERVMGGSFLDININRKEANRYGLTTGYIQDIISTAIGGQIVTTTVEGLERYGVNVRYPRDLRDDPSSLRDILVPVSARASVPLGQLASFELTEGPPMIKSENARPNAWIYIDINDNVDLGSYVEKAREAVREKVPLPPGYSVRWSGQFEYMERANKRLSMLIPITLVIIFFLLYVHFRDVTQTLVLLSTLPFAVIGAIWLMVILDFNMSIAVGVGFIAVSGLAAETGVVMQVYLNEAIGRFRRQGRLNTRSDLREALEEGAVQRVRPILMTVLTTIIGLIPVMVGSEPGSEVMKRLATPMVGGLITSAVLILILIPAVYAAIYGRKLERAAARKE